jgi:type I restriction enzyme S subunit
VTERALIQSRNPLLGKIPAHWKEAHLAHVARIPITNGLGEAAADGDEEWPRYIRTTDISGLHSLDPTKRVTLPPDKAAGALLEDSDLLMTAAGSLGTSYLHRGSEPACFAGYLVRFRAELSRILPSYAAWWTYSRHHLDQIALGAVRSTIDNFSAGKFRSMLVPLPPLSEQRAIADFLDRESAQIDTLVDEQQRLVQLLTERRAAVVSHAAGWSGCAPANWAKQRLSWIFEATGSGTTPAPEDLVDPDDQTIPWVTTGELRESRIHATTKAVRRESLASYSALRVHPAGSLLIAMYGATIGRMAILDVDATSNQACCALSTPSRASSEFVQYSLLAARSRLLLDAAGGGQPNINQDKVRSFRIPLPPNDEQGAIVAYLDEQTAKIDALIAETERFIELSRERRAALITAAVTGQIDVRREVA